MVSVLAVSRLEIERELSDLTLPPDMYVYEIDGQRVFAVYASNGTPCTALCLNLVLNRNGEWRAKFVEFGLDDTSETRLKKLNDAISKLDDFVPTKPVLKSFSGNDAGSEVR